MCRSGAESQTQLDQLDQKQAEIVDGVVLEEEQL